MRGNGKSSDRISFQRIFGGGGRIVGDGVFLGEPGTEIDEPAALAAKRAVLRLR
jgi:hypothetical protein